MPSHQCRRRFSAAEAACPTADPTWKKCGQAMSSGHFPWLNSSPIPPKAPSAPAARAARCFPRLACPRSRSQRAGSNYSAPSTTSRGRDIPRTWQVSVNVVLAFSSSKVTCHFRIFTRSDIILRYLQIQRYTCLHIVSATLYSSLSNFEVKHTFRSESHSLNVSHSPTRD
jgi:hypothetical protein